MQNYLGFDEAILSYIDANTVREPSVLRDLREETMRMPDARMQITADQGQLMGLLARAIGAKRYLEIGVFTGYSALVMAQALPSDGYVLACDVSEEFTAIARRYWQHAGVAAKVDLRLAPALQTLDAEIAKGSSFDIAFIDADKENYDGYFERALQLVRSGGLILLDNMLWSGDVVRSEEKDDVTRGLDALNRKIGRDERVDCSLLPIRDGLMIARKR